MAFYNQLFFKESALAHQLLDGKKGLEIGGGRHNQWGLDVVNCDKYGPGTPQHQMYADAQIKHCGEAMPVDIVAPGDKIPVADKSFDFVIASHVIEHFFDPIAALKEWARIAREFVFIICPQPEALDSDRGKLITSFDELQARHSRKIPDPGTDEHHTRWTSGTFVDMCNRLGYTVHTVQDPDDKVGNGFTVVLDVRKILKFDEALTDKQKAKIEMDFLVNELSGHTIKNIAKKAGHPPIETESPVKGVLVPAKKSKK